MRSRIYGWWPVAVLGLSAHVLAGRSTAAAPAPGDRFLSTAASASPQSNGSQPVRAVNSDAFWKLRKRIQEAEKRKDWSTAITLTRQLIAEFRESDYLPEHVHREEIGQFYLNQLDLDAAEREFQSVIEAKGKYSPNLDTWQTAAAGGLARVCALRRNYTEAFRWLRMYEESFGSGCGSCIDARGRDARSRRAVWMCAALPDVDAEKKLRDLIAGKTGPMDPRTWRVDDAGAELLSSSTIREAEMALAELMLRHGDAKQARKLLKHVATRDDTLAAMAETRLKSLSASK